MTLRIGRVGYLNTRPLFVPLEEAPGVELVEDVPTRLNEMLRVGEIDVAIASSIEYARHPEQYVVLPDLSVSSRASVGSVLLVGTDTPRSGRSELCVYPTPASATSCVLLSVLARPPIAVLPPIRLVTDPQDAQARLLIGDEALTERLSGAARHQVDLGQLWASATGLPMVWALFLVRRAVLRGHDRAVLAGVHQTLVQAARDPALVCVARAHASRTGLAEKALVEYLMGLEWGLGPEHVKGLERFYALARAAGDLEGPVPPLEFAFGGQAVAT